MCADYLRTLIISVTSSVLGWYDNHRRGRFRCDRTTPCDAVHVCLSVEFSAGAHRGRGLPSGQTTDRPLSRATRVLIPRWPSPSGAPKEIFRAVPFWELLTGLISPSVHPRALSQMLSPRFITVVAPNWTCNLPLGK